MCRLKSKSAFSKANPKECSTLNYRCTKINYETYKTRTVWQEKSNMNEVLG
jgi:hypothetical protein